MMSKKEFPITPKENFRMDDTTINNMLEGGVKDVLPCPMCGGTKVMISGRLNENSGNIVWSATCSTDIFDCSVNVHACLGGDEKNKEAKQKVIDQWNRRAQ